MIKGNGDASTATRKVGVRAARQRLLWAFMVLPVISTFSRMSVTGRVSKQRVQGLFIDL